MLAKVEAPDRDPAAKLTRTPHPPRHLAPAATREWKQLAPVAARLGTLTEADRRAFELLVNTLVTEAEARAVLAREGFTVPTADGGSKPHPAVRIMEKARDQAARLLDAFGLTPKGRNGVERAKASADDAWGGLLD